MNKNTLHQHYQSIKKQFEDKFKDSFTLGAMQNWEDGKIVLSFLQSALASQLEEVEKVVEGMKRNDLKDTIIQKILHRHGTMHERYIETGKAESQCNHYNQALQDLLLTLQQEKDLIIKDK